MQAKLASQAGSELADQAVEMDGFKLVTAELGGLDSKALREQIDQLKSKLNQTVIVLAAVDDKTVRLAAGVSKSLTDRFHAGKLVNHVAQQVGGKGGGRPDFAQAGGQNNGNLSAALDSITEWLHNAG